MGRKKGQPALAKRYPLPQKSLLSIEYPGHVNNVENAIKSIGGREKLARDISEDLGAHIELRYRYNDPTSQPINGEIFTDQGPVPTEPTPEAIKDIDQIPKELISRVKNILDETPVVGRNVMDGLIPAAERAGFRIPVVACMMSYIMETGPWRSCWIRFGYDPRTDPESYKYQILDQHGAEEEPKDLDIDYEELDQLIANDRREEEAEKSALQMIRDRDESTLLGVSSQVVHDRVNARVDEFMRELGTQQNRGGLDPENAEALGDMLDWEAEEFDIYGEDESEDGFDDI
ncbi:tau 95 subunit of transcription factor TFIIIC [Coemansia sp. Benny D115]|nr:tau 95 subunit of transcription factor TFIIIC [Coemansia sp. Benny D115]